MLRWLSPLPPSAVARPWLAAIVCVFGLTLSLSGAAAQTANNAVRLPEAPDLAFAATELVQTRCGACHLSRNHRRLPPLLPSLRTPAKLAADRALVTPGRPDLSALVWRMLDAHHARAPTSAVKLPKPDRSRSDRPVADARALSDDVWLVRRWIARLPRRMEPAPIGAANVLAAGTTEEDAGWLRVDVVQPVFEVGEHIVYRVQANRHCRLSLINVDPRGIATVIFPNAYARANQIGAQVAREVPAVDDPFVFTARDRGVEKLIALCADGDGAALGIRHDFTHQRFTVLGDWEQFLATGKPPQPLAASRNRVRWRYRRVRRCYRYKRKGRRLRRCRWVRRRAGRIPPKPTGPLPLARLKAVAVVAVRVH